MLFVAGPSRISPRWAPLNGLPKLRERPPYVRGRVQVAVMATSRPYANASMAKWAVGLGKTRLDDEFSSTLLDPIDCSQDGIAMERTIC